MKNHLLLYYSLIMFMVAPLAGRVSAHYTYNTWMLPPTPPCGTPGGTAVYTDPMDIIGIGGWQTGSGNGGVITDFSVVPGYNGQALQVTYDLGTTKGAWVQIYHNFDPAVNWSAGDHVRFIHQGTQPNSLEIGLVSSENIPGPNYFGSSWNASSHIPWWTYATWDLKDFYRDDNGVRRPFPDLSQVKGIFISIVNKAPEDLGNSGTIIFDEFQIINIASRAVPASFEPLVSNPAVTQAAQNAASWIAARQQSNGLLKSWQEEANDFSWLYDQALGLIVLSETDLPKARLLAEKLHSLQNADGSWYFGYHYLNSAAIDFQKDTGPIAWTVYALTTYYAHETDNAKANTAYQDAREGAGWLTARQAADGSVSVGITEWNLDTWWALQAAGYPVQADRLKNYLLSQVWDSNMGRFRSSATTRQIFLDNQTWGAAFLQAIERDDDARRALSYAQATLLTTSSDNVVCGFDGAGPFSIWNEGTLQYIAEGGANSAYYWGEMVAQQAVDGGMPNSPEPVTPIPQNPGSCTQPATDNFCAYIVWLSHWHGVAPTAWLYFAATGGPYPPYPPSLLNAAPSRNYFTTDIPTLSWNRVTGATQYEIQVDNTRTFTAPLSFSATVPANTLYATTTPLLDGIHYWRVRALSQDGIPGAWSAIESFIVNVP